MDIIKARQEILQGKTIYDMHLRVVDYGRVSTDKDDQLNSLENQINYFNDLIKDVPNWVHIRSYSDEGISGTQVFKREQFLQMMEDARCGKIDLILTKEVSRFARNTIDSIKYTQKLLEYGVIVLFISDNINTINPDSEFRLTLMASLAQDEVRKLSERVKFGIKRSIKDGKVGGGGIYGYIKDKCTLTIIEEEAKVVRKIFELYATGEYGFKKIGEMLAREGYYTRKGKIFSDMTIKKMLLNPRYKGYYTANLSEVKDYKTHKKIKKPKEEWIIYKDNSGRVPAIVSEELWNKANYIYNDRNKHWAKTVLNRECYIKNRKYTSKLFCKEHNSVFIRKSSGKRTNNPVWICNEYLRYGIKGCKTPILYEKYLDKIFCEMLLKYFENKNDLIEEFLLDYKTLIQENDLELKIRNIKEMVKEKKKSKEKLLDLALKYLISDEDFKSKNKKIEEEINKLEIDLEKLENTKKDFSNQEKNIQNIREFINSKFEIKENIAKFFNIFIDRVYVSKIKDNRKHIKLEVSFAFEQQNEELEIALNNFLNH